MQGREKRGTRCHICTGCGRCFEGEGVSVIADGGLTEIWQKKLLEERKRLEAQGYPQGNVQEARQEDSRKSPRRTEELAWIVAADLGTTTIAMVLYDTNGRERDRFVTVNPQIQYGSDVISRIQAASRQNAIGRDDGCWSMPAKEMQESVKAVLEKGIARFHAVWKAESGDKDPWVRMVLAGNTTMLYLLLGFLTEELGRAPFRASHLDGAETCLAGLQVTILPGLSAFVGADILAGVLACGMAEQEDVTLFLDLGTNGEMALGNAERIIACSTAAGPAFEGGATRGIWGADMVHLTSILLRKGVLDETGLLADPYFEEGIRIGGVKIVQSHIRQLQLAKGAIAAGIETLARMYGLSGMEQIGRVVLAGGFGYYLQAEDAARIGLLPMSLADKTVSAGNAVLAGAFRYGFFTKNASEMIRRIVERTKVLNLAEEAEFAGRYLEMLDLRPWQ